MKKNYEMTFILDESHRITDVRPYKVFTCLPLRYIVLAVVMICMLAVYSDIQAQGKSSFIAGNKAIRIDSFNTQLQHILDEVGIPALSVAVINNDQVVFSNTYGFKQQGEKTKASAHTVFEAASLTKIFLVYAVHKLVDEGRLDLDKPLYQYLEYEHLKHDDRYKKITSRMVLGHSSGIENWKRYNNQDTLEILSNPGEKFVYSGEGFHYLAKVVETILQEPYERYIDRMVLKPLKMDHTYLRYKKDNSKLFQKESPSDYAFGHDDFGRKLNKWKNTEPVPASGIHTTAEDFARLMVAVFNGKNLSGQRTSDLVKKVVSVGSESSGFYMGPGFFVIAGNKDTIVSFSGNNDGFKAEVFYSVVHKKGFVFLTNSDQGKLITERMCELTSLDGLADLFQGSFFRQFPSTALSLQKIYREKGSGEMFTEINRLRQEGRLDAGSLNELGEKFKSRDKEISRKLLETCVEWFPESPTAYGLLGSLYLQINEVDLAFKSFRQAQALHFDLWNVEDDLRMCAYQMKERERRNLLLVSVEGSRKSKIQCEDYNAMSGVQVETTEDAGGGQNVGYIDSGDWMEYKVNIREAGDYQVSFRVASPEGGGQIQLRSGASVLATADIKPTKGWQSWTTLSTQVKLSSGSQTIRINVTKGGFNINWIELAPVGSAGQ